MTVDFALKRVPKVQIASLHRRGPWKSDILRSEFRQLSRWARAQSVRPGRWIFYEHTLTHWEACLEIRGRAPAETGRIRVRTLPAASVASVLFDPEAVAPRVVYHGLADWLRQRRKERKVGRTLGSREVYAGDPWASSTAWAHTEIQFLLGPK